MNKYVNENSQKLINLIQNIFNRKGNFRLFCIDIDDVVVNFKPWLQEQLGKIDYRATDNYRREIASEESQDYDHDRRLSFKILDEILEEQKKEYEGLIDYKSFYQNPNNVYKCAIKYINMLLQNKQDGDFFVFLTHRNIELEKNVKIEEFSKYCPNIDGIITPSFHDLEGKKVNKLIYVMDFLHIDKKYAKNLVLIDNTKKNVRDFIDGGAVGIRFLEPTYKGHFTMKDYLTKLADLDPVNIDRVMAAIEYEKEHPGCFDEEFFKYNLQNIEVVSRFVREEEQEFTKKK